MNRRPRAKLTASSSSPEEAAAITAALEQFVRDTAPPPAPAAPRRMPWQRAALFEGVGSQGPAPLPWLDPDPWE